MNWFHPKHWSEGGMDVRVLAVESIREFEVFGFRFLGFL